MRKRSVVAIVAATALTASGGLAYAGSNQDDPPTNPPQSDEFADSITLLSGDEVDLLPGGAVRTSPAEGRDHMSFYSPILPSGERLVIPLDHISEVYSGATDPQLYNVDQLAAGGFTDASDVRSGDELGENPLTGETQDSDETVEVTIDFRWNGDEVPYIGFGMWSSLDDRDQFDFFLAEDDGLTTFELEPGNYLLGLSGNDAPEDPDRRYVSTQRHVEITEDSEFSVDLADGHEVDIEVDGVETVGHDHAFSMFSAAGDDDLSGSIMHSPEGTSFNVIPHEDETDRTTGFGFASELSTAEGETYSVVEFTEEGIAADPLLTVDPANLAERTVSYENLDGDPVEMRRANSVEHPYSMGLPPVLESLPVETLSTRTEYYTTGDDVEWAHYGDLPGAAADTSTEIYRSMGSFETGPSSDEWFDSGALSVSLGDLEVMGGMIHLQPQDPALPYTFSSGPLVFNAHHPSEWTRDINPAGESELRDEDADETIAVSSSGSFVSLESEEPLDGRYSVSHDATRDVEWTHLGTESEVRWEFDVAPDEEILDVSVVEFDVDGIEQGYVDGDEALEFSLEFATQTGADERECVDLTFQVSFDDGETWEDVDIDRDGNLATASVDAPDNAEFVSVAFTAEDDAGQTVEHSTIRSFGLS